MARGSGKNIHRNNTRPHVNKRGLVMTKTMIGRSERENLNSYELWLLSKGLY